ncbi:unnamed protein product [Phytophthora fragariaefolia]|uniref:Unnamed protein product n=1 Tax=Phytophthora fragariaefolia TaxID=1490495 RepID=A0A9W6TNN4_9STRA|nr:unnamed protein product [Phytophthora fragariaefolia]
MATDATFLDEVDDFLASFELPTLPNLRPMDDDAVSTPQDAPKLPDCTAGRKTQPQPLDAAAKLQLMREKDRKRRSAYRERRKLEKATLEKEVGGLSAQLLELQRARRAKRSLASSAWEMVAKRQLQARVDVEEKQRRLITAVESQANVIEQFKDILHCRLGCSTSVDDAGYKQKRIRFEPSDAEFYKSLENELDANHANTDAMLQKYGLNSTEAGWDGPRRRWTEEGANGYYIYADKHVMPFDYKHVCKFTWKVAQITHRQEGREHYAYTSDPENTSAIKFRVSTRLRSGRVVSVLQRAVVRRYAREDRSVTVWRSFAEGEGIFSGMHADECGWCVAIPLPSSPNAKTLKRTLMRHVPMHFSTKETHESEVQQFTGLVLDAGTENATEITSLMEELLLRDR